MKINKDPLPPQKKGGGGKHWRKGCFEVTYDYISLDFIYQILDRCTCTYYILTFQ